MFSSFLLLFFAAEVVILVLSRFSSCLFFTLIGLAIQLRIAFVKIFNQRYQCMYVCVCVSVHSICLKDSCKRSILYWLLSGFRV